MCVNLGYGEWERLYFRKVSLRKGRWIGEGAESRKPLKPEMPVIFGSSFSHTPCNYQLGFIPSSEYMLLSFVWPSPFVVAPVTAFLNWKSFNWASLLPAISPPLQSPWVTLITSPAFKPFFCSEPAIIHYCLLY